MIKGSIVALVTPFHADGSVNFEKLGELIEWHIVAGTDAVLVLGTTGETPTMTHEEDTAVVEYAIKKAAGRIPIYVGAGSNHTQTQITYCKKYEAMGAEALLVISPYYNKANEEGMYRHFAATADAVHTPLILYNVPGRTGCSIPISVVKRLAAHPNIAAIKEASGNMSYAMQVAELINDNFQMLSGNDDITVPLMSVGGSGVISVWANIMPEVCKAMVEAAAAGDFATARSLQLRYLTLMNDLFIEVNPIPVKEALNLMGRNVGGFRLPLCEMTQAHRDVLAASMKEAGLL